MICECDAMREERAAVELVGGRGALCAGADDAAADVVAFMTRFSIAVDGVNQAGCVYLARI